MAAAGSAASPLASRERKLLLERLRASLPQRFVSPGGTDNHRMRALLALTLLLAISQAALAGDWRYCLAPSHTARKVYISPPFPATMPMDDAESQFGRRLAARGLRFDDVQCPRSDDETAALTMQQHAIVINRELGNEVINLRWKPGG
jgi:hypothetical protein